MFIGRQEGCELDERAGLQISFPGNRSVVNFLFPDGSETFFASMDEIEVAVKRSRRRRRRRRGVSRGRGLSADELSGDRDSIASERSDELPRIIHPSLYTHMREGEFRREGVLWGRTASKEESFWVV